MEPHIHLLVHNIAMGASGLIAIGLALFAFVNNPRRTQNVTFTLSMLAVATFVFSHIIGVSVIDPELSRTVFMWNISTIFIVIFNTHCILSVINKEKERKTTLNLIYAVGVLLTLVFAFFPDLFLAPSVAKMYFPNYYVPGMYHWVMRVIFNGIVPVYSMIELAIAYRVSKDVIERTRYTYFLWASIVGYSVGSIPILLVYNIPVDPAWGAFFVLFYAVPLVYAIVQYQLLDIRIIAKKAFTYALSIGVVGAFIILFEVSNQWIKTIYPTFPLWVTPLVSSIFVVSITVFIWKKLRENDLLKYEFITTVTHKFRTPLTYVKWATENLLKGNLVEEQREQVSYIQRANEKLVELTDILAAASDAQDTEYGYQMKQQDFAQIVADAVLSVTDELTAKKIHLVQNITSDVNVLCDHSRIQFVIQVLLENALHYTHEDGNVTLTLNQKGKNAFLSVSDDGIGITKENLPLIFSKFYRSSEARKSDTEGMGIALYLSREIMFRHRGSISAESEGLNKGSAFTISLPLA